ncbi:hypothetical protein C8Q75DRAFT_71781 [Abortiporus biennis]|nr:hypothetical protein C8Q75DRAFT_71781 [Abortiporus biennis]
MSLNVLFFDTLKIALIIVTMICDSVAYTQPVEGTAGQDARAKYNAHKSPLNFLHKLQLTTYIPPVYKRLMHLLCLSEIYLLLARHFPQLTVPTLTSILVPFPVRGSPATIDLTWTFLSGYLLLTSGAMLRYKCYQALGKHFTFELALVDGHKLCTLGPYSYVRHPSYVGILMCTLGDTLCHFGSGSWWAECLISRTTWGFLLSAFCAFAIISISMLIFVRVPKEDAVLKREFRDEWMAWSRRVPYALIPYVF